MQWCSDVFSVVSLSVSLYPSLCANFLSFRIHVVLALLKEILRVGFCFCVNWGSIGPTWQRIGLMWTYMKDGWMDGWMDGWLWFCCVFLQEEMKRSFHLSLFLQVIFSFDPKVHPRYLGKAVFLYMVMLDLKYISAVSLQWCQWFTFRPIFYLLTILN